SATSFSSSLFPQPHRSAAIRKQPNMPFHVFFIYVNPPNILLFSIVFRYTQFYYREICKRRKGDKSYNTIKKGGTLFTRCLPLQSFLSYSSSNRSSRISSASICV